eukprot:4370076-Prymnesium_polylepis.1
MPSASSASGARPASTAAGGAFASLLRPAPMERGALWHREPLQLSDGFSTSFGFRVHNQSLCTRLTAAGCAGRRVGGSGFGF